MARTPVSGITRRVQTPCSLCPLRALKSFRKFTAEELRFVERFKAGEVKLARGQTVLTEDENSEFLYTVLSGWLVKYKMLEDGRRQVINYAVPGDFLGLQAATFGKMQHSVEALSEVTLCVFPKKKIWTLYEHHQGLGFDVTWIAAQEKTILAEFLVSAGQRTSIERIAFLLLILFGRARMVGLVRKNVVHFPFNQEHLADTIGFSLVHTNKCLARLRRTSAFEWIGDTFTMLDEERLAALVGRPVIPPGLKPFI
jgi:CRP/FNR family transcriptional regulator, anaerobic regulatory protein